MAKKPRGRKRLSSAPIQHAMTMKRMTRDHQDVLENIEFVFVEAYREDDSIDDAAVLETLRAALGRAEATDPRAMDMLERLAEVRELRSDVSDEVWRGGLHIVQQSVRRHSLGRPGETDYLRFIATFIP